LAVKRNQQSVSCGSLVRETRKRHGLDQSELARRAGTEQPAISRIERNVVSPSLDTLNRLFEAMGETLVVTPVSLADPPPGGGNQSIAELRADYRDLTAEERLAQAAQLSRIATELAAGAEFS
jgi:transcriptional regulator with XRE-family HTH domain